MNLTETQQNVSQDLLKYIKSNNITINSPEDLSQAFRDYLIHGSASHFYLQTADEHQKKQFSNRIKSELKL
ncbi:hypothetical protein ABE425_14765 [Chryseobacterium cucumeris]|uniref:hypothetical protein n=1 Tax=Chryseobacterium cucumeris TaxID=1813611 RepID=UPI0032088C8E